MAEGVCRRAGVLTGDGWGRWRWGGSRHKVECEVSIPFGNEKNRVADVIVSSV